MVDWRCDDGTGDVVGLADEPSVQIDGMMMVVLCCRDQDSTSLCPQLRPPAGVC